MKKYSIEELQKLDRDELIALAKTIIEGNDDFILEEWKIIEDKLRGEIQVKKHQKLYTMAQASETIGMTENELTDSLTDMGFGEYLVTEDQLHTIQ